MKIHVHLGAHKTATTFIQSQLADNKAMLAGKGFGVAGIWIVRKRFTNAFDRLAWFDPVWRLLTRPYLARRLDTVLGESAGAGTFVLSDENLLGLIAANYYSGRLYPFAGQRCGILKSLLSGHETRYFLCIRNYADYLTSSWLQLATRGKPPPFDKYLDRFQPEGRGWADIVSDIARVVGRENLTVWTYDWFAENPARAFSLLVPGVAMDIPEEERKRDVLPSLTIKGLNVISQLEDHLTKGELKRMSALIRNFPFEEPNPRLEISETGLVEAYERKYREDRARIGALGVDFHDTLPREESASA